MYLNLFFLWNYALKMLKLYSRFTVKRRGFTTCGCLPHHRGSFSIFERCRTLVCCFYPEECRWHQSEEQIAQDLVPVAGFFPPLRSGLEHFCINLVSLSSVPDPSPWWIISFYSLRFVCCQSSVSCRPDWCLGDCSAGLWYSVSLGCRRPRLSEIK